MSNLKTAICLAARIHDGQLDASGDPYILHVLRVMLAQTDDDRRIVGALHDVIENSNLPLEYLLLEGFSQDIVDAVDAMTRRKDEDYLEFVQRAASNPIALAVTVADLRDNLQASREDSGRKHGEKYGRALEMLGYPA